MIVATGMTGMRAAVPFAIKQVLEETLQWASSV
jgi:hypothetical protein